MANLQVLIGKEKLKNRGEIFEYIKRSIIEKTHTKEIKRSMFDHAIRLAKDDKDAEFADWLEGWSKEYTNEYIGYDRDSFNKIRAKIKELRKDEN